MANGRRLSLAVKYEGIILYRILYRKGEWIFVRKMLISMLLVLTCLLSFVPAAQAEEAPEEQTSLLEAQDEAVSEEPSDVDVMASIFGKSINDTDQDEYADRLPYNDGTVLADVREPLLLYDSFNYIGEYSMQRRHSVTYGKDLDEDWETLQYQNEDPFPLGKGEYVSGRTYRTVTVGGTTYYVAQLLGDVRNHEDYWKVLNAAEGDFDNDGKKDELALLVALKTAEPDNKGMLLLCTAPAEGGTIVPIKILYRGTPDFYDNINEFANFMEIVCADVNGDGYDEIFTSTPTNRFAGKASDGTLYQTSSDPYQLDLGGGLKSWFLVDGTKGNKGVWNTEKGWNASPVDLGVGLSRDLGDNCAPGAAGTTAALAAADIDGDGYDDLVCAVSSTKAKYNDQLWGTAFRVMYIGGAPTVSGENGMLAKRHNLMNDLSGGEVYENLWLGYATHAQAAGFDVEICDVDGSGKPTIFLSFKETNVQYSGGAWNSGPNMWTPRFYIFSFDMVNRDYNRFKASLVYEGGIYHHGWTYKTGTASDDVVADPIGSASRTSVIDSAPVRIGVLAGDFGRSKDENGNHPTGYLSSGTIVADQRLFSFVRKAGSDKYDYEITNECLYTDSSNMKGDLAGYPGVSGHRNSDDNGSGFADEDCVFYRNGINVTGVKTAKVYYFGSDDKGKTVVQYKDTAVVTAYEDGGKRFAIRLTENDDGSYTPEPLYYVGTTYAAVAMPDVDDDSIYLKFDHHRFFWADPVIIAALASPPYFDALPSDQWSNSQTTYGTSTEKETSVTSSFTIGSGYYTSTEIKGGSGGVSGVFEQEMEYMRSSTTEKEYSTSVSFSQGYAASGGADTVVLSTVAFDGYAYTAYYPGEDGTTTESDYIVYVPRGGEGAVRVASVNADDYAGYAQYANGALPDLSKVFTHTVGDPNTYPQPGSSEEVDMSSIPNAVKGTILVHESLANLPADLSEQDQSIEFTKSFSEANSVGSSVSSQIGGGVEAETDKIFKYATYASQVTGGSVSEKSYESGKVKTNVEGVSVGGVVYGQGDGANTSGGTGKAFFGWRLLTYLYEFKDEESGISQRFPVVTYLLSNIQDPVGVTPTRLQVDPLETNEVQQVGPATVGFTSSVEFKAEVAGVTRAAATELVDAPDGMELSIGNISSSGTIYFEITIDSNVKPGEYPLYLKVGGKLSNPFSVVVKEYTAPEWLGADPAEIDFGEMRYLYSSASGADPRVDPQTVTISNTSSSEVNNLKAVLDPDSDFAITEDLSSNALYPYGSDKSMATVKVAPKAGLAAGTHTGTLMVSNSKTGVLIPLKYTVTPPNLPGTPSLLGSVQDTPNPLTISVSPPADDGGGDLLAYLFTVQNADGTPAEGFADSNGKAIWQWFYGGSRSGGVNFILQAKESHLTVGQEYTVGVKMLTSAGESGTAWGTVRIIEGPDKPDKVQNVKCYPSADSILVTWEPVKSWGENEYFPEITNKDYSVTCVDQETKSGYVYTVHPYANTEYMITGLTPGKVYDVWVESWTLYGSETSDTVSVTTSEPATASAPSRPKDFKAEMSYQTAELSWAAPTYTGGGITGYEVSKDNGATWVSLAQDVTSYTFTGLTTNQEYTFCVRAKNAIGRGDSAVQVQTAPSNIPAPTFVMPSGDLVGYKAELGYEQVDVAWEPLADASGYEAKVDNGKWVKIQPVEFDGNLHYIFTGLTNDIECLLYIRGYNDEGVGPADKVAAKPSSLAPRLPKNAGVTAKNGAIEIYGEADGGASFEYDISGDDDDWWWMAGRESGLTNGQTYTVAVAASATVQDGNYYGPMRSRIFFTVTPDASIPDPPDFPDITAVVDDENIQFAWSVENDGGSPVTSYEYSAETYSWESGRETLVSTTAVPADVTSVSIKRSEIPIDEWGIQSEVDFHVAAINEAGSSDDKSWSGGTLDVRLNVEFQGPEKILVPSDSSGNFTSDPYSYVQVYVWENEVGQMERFEYPLDGDWRWNLISNNQYITWDAENNCIVVNEAIPNGTYPVTLEYQDFDYGDTPELTYAKRIEITVGADIPEVTVTLDAQGGFVSKSALTYRAGALLGELPDPIRTGYVFTGWSRQPQSSAIISANSFYVTDDITLYAQWVEETQYFYREVTFDPNGGSGTMDILSGKQGSAVVLPSNSFEPPDNMRFRAWEIDGLEYAPGAYYTLDGFATAYAVWEEDVNSDKAQIIVESKAGKAGETVDVQVSLKNNPGVASMMLAIGYDDSVLTLTEVKDAGVLGSQMHSNRMQSPYMLSWANDTSGDTRANGTIVTLTFAVADNAAADTYPVTVSYDAENDYILNADLERVDFTTVNGSVIVSTDALIGDANGDNRVTAIDRTYIARYVAQWEGYDDENVNTTAADVNADGKVTAVDRAILARYLAKWEGYLTLPYQKPQTTAEDNGELCLLSVNSGVIQVSTIQGTPGTTVPVTISLKDNPGLVSMQLSVSYDASALSLVNVTDAGLLGAGPYHNTNLNTNPYVLSWGNDTAQENCTGNGLIVTLQFKIKDSAASGYYPVTVSYDESRDEIYDKDFKPVSFDTEDGGVSVIASNDTTKTLEISKPGTGNQVDVAIYSPQKASALLCVVAYDGNWKMLDLKLENVELPKAEELTRSISMRLADALYLKAFLVDSSGIPLAKAPLFTIRRS